LAERKEQELKRLKNVKSFKVTEMAINNLFNEQTIVSISVMTDYTNRFVMLFKDFEAERGQTYTIDRELECMETIIIRVQTSEGFHTKNLKCENPRTGSIITETFVPKLASMVQEVKISEDYS